MSEQNQSEQNANRVAQRKNMEAWNALRRFGQPLVVVSMIGSIVMELHKRSDQFHELYEPAVTFPLAGIALASCVNFNTDNPRDILKNYLYFFVKGLFVSMAILLSNPSEVFFSKLNEGWLKDIFTGNLLHMNYGFGFRTMVLFHTINLFASPVVTNVIYNQ